jgi:hypothetical protein
MYGKYLLKSIRGNYVLLNFVNNQNCCTTGDVDTGLSTLGFSLALPTVIITTRLVGAVPYNYEQYTAKIIFI